MTARGPGVSVWLGAARPATLTASAAPVLVGTALARADGALHLDRAAAAFAGAAAIQIGTNLWNDYADGVRGADGPDRLGPARATARGWLAPRTVAAAALATFGLAVAIGLYLVAAAGWPLLAVGLVSVLAGLAYTSGPWPLAYVGLGDLFVVVFFGLVATAGTHYVQALALDPLALVAGAAVGLQAAAILVVNNLRDRVGDARAGKRTLVVRFGAAFGRAEHAATLLLPYGLAAGVAIATGEPGWLLPLASLPLAVREALRVRRLDGAALGPCLGGTARVGLGFATLLALGVVL